MISNRSFVNIMGKIDKLRKNFFSFFQLNLVFRNRFSAFLPPGSGSAWRKWVRIQEVSHNVDPSSTECSGICMDPVPGTRVRHIHTYMLHLLQLWQVRFLCRVCICSCMPETWTTWITNWLIIKLLNKLWNKFCFRCNLLKNGKSFFVVAHFRVTFKI